MTSQFKLPLAKKLVRIVWVWQGAYPSDQTSKWYNWSNCL